MTIRQDRKYHWLTGDVNWKDYGGKWYRYDGYSCYTIIELINMDDACGDVSDGKYLVIVSDISLSDVSLSTVQSAYRSCGIAATEETMKDQLFLLEVLHGYGACDNIANKYGNNYLKLMKWAKSI